MSITKTQFFELQSFMITHSLMLNDLFDFIQYKNELSILSFYSDFQIAFFS